MPGTITRRRSRRDEEADEAQEEQQESRSSRRSRGDDEERPTRSRSRRSSRDEDEGEDRPSRSRRGRSRDAEEEDEPKGRSRKRRGASGFAHYEKVKRSSGFSDREFKPGDNEKTLIKIQDEEPFDTFNQHWINDRPKGERKSFMCMDDDPYFEDDGDCPLCEIGENATTYSLFNIIDFSKKRSPEVRIWKASPPVADALLRASQERKTSPINREDLYFEVEKVVKGKKTTWNISPVKARDLEEDYRVTPLDPEELDSFESDKYSDRSDVQHVDTWDELNDLADEL